MRTDQLRPYSRAGKRLVPLEAPIPGKVNSGKAPILAGWRNATYPKDVLKGYVKRGHNLGVALECSDLVLDIDPRHFPEGEDSLVSLEAELEIPLRDVAPCVLTGGGGMHLYFRKPADLPTVGSLPDFPGVEFKSHGQQIVAAGALHYTGGRYEWDDLGPDLEDACELPSRLLTLIRRPPPRKVDGCGELSAEAVAECLEQLDVEDFQGHDKWLELMMACHFASAGEAREEFVQWSQGDPLYASHDWLTGRRWDSLSTKRDGPTVTTATLFKRVIEAGGVLPGGHAADDFDAIEETEDAPDEPVKEEAGGDKLLNRMNARYCAVKMDGRFRILSRERDEHRQNQLFWEAMTKKDFEDYLEERRIQTPDKTVPLATWWLQHPKRRKYRGVTFSPEREVKGKLNLWEGWAVEPRRGSWSGLEDIIRGTLCDGDAAMAEYTLNWCAFLVQHPASPAETALVFQGRKGTGKGTLGSALMRICGRHGAQINQQEQFTSRFNSHLRQCVFLFANECMWAGDHVAQGMLKAMITEKETSYEGKGKDQKAGRNLLHILMGTNSEWVVPAGLDGERRFAISRVSERVPTRRTFDLVHAQMAGGGTEAFLFDLQSRDIDGWHPRNDIPNTEALAEQKRLSMEPVEEWWFTTLGNGVLPGSPDDWEAGPSVAFSADLVESCARYCRELRVSRRSLETKIGRVLHRLTRDPQKTRICPPPGAPMVIDSQGRARAYRIGSLESCRRAFEDELGSPVEW